MLTNSNINFFLNNIYFNRGISCSGKGDSNIEYSLQEKSNELMLGNMDFQ